MLNLKLRYCSPIFLHILTRFLLNLFKLLEYSYIYLRYSALSVHFMQYHQKHHSYTHISDHQRYNTKIRCISEDFLPYISKLKEIASNICLKNISDCFVAAFQIEIYFLSNLSESRADWKCTLYLPPGEAIDIPTIQCMNKI